MVKKGISIDSFSCFDVLQETNISITGIPHKANLIPLIIIGGVMLLQGIMKGMGDSAAAKAANNAKLQAHYTETMKSGQSNGKAVFDSARNTALQMSRNQNIAEAAYLNKQEGETKARDAGVFKQNELSRAVSAQNAAMQNVQAGKNIGSSSGSARAMAIATSLNAMKASSVVSNNLQNDLRNVQAGFKNQMSQQTFNVYIPNMDAPPNPPALASTSAPLVSGVVGGALNAVSAIAGGMGGAPGGAPAAAGATVAPAASSLNFGGPMTAGTLGSSTGGIQLSNGSNIN